MITPVQGRVYVVKHSSGFIEARFLHESRHGGYGNRRETTHYVFHNLITGRDIVLKSRIKIKREVAEKGANQ